MEELCQLFGPLLYVLRRHSFHLGSRSAGSGVELIDIKYWKFVPKRVKSVDSFQRSVMFCTYV